ncbi:hypothetical protein [Clostridium fermenticellae]|uniref:hypothetical protein n=1 Tax=Clostridium fermenticellae TaxID=2068654 RepID=UPI0018F876F5|nr:hypothetical protein [Clostridium fermenticellae]
MSLPNIPNITPIIDITRDEAINMLMASIAMEEMGLSHIINAESEKIQYILNPNKCKCVSINDIKEINQGVEKIIRDVTNLQVFLQEKLENITKLIPKPADYSNPCFTCSPDQYHSLNFSIIGSGSGRINNKCDSFNHGIFNIKANINHNDCETNLSLKYVVQKKKDNYNISAILLAIPESMSFNNINDFKNNNKEDHNCNNDIQSIVIKGQGIISLKDENKVLKQYTVNFIFKLWNYDNCQKIKMIINSCNSKFNHDSGIVSIESGCLQIK